MATSGQPVTAVGMVGRRVVLGRGADVGLYEAFAVKVVLIRIA